jgi:S-disulfanyl-L-cysteine oxidoreductase SoxD
MGVCKMRCSPDRNLAVMVLAVTVAGVAALAQTPSYSGVGRTPSQQEILAEDIAISIDGMELPPGSGTAKEGAQIYAEKCVECHGPNLEGVRAGEDNPLGPALVGGRGTLTTNHPVQTVESYWAFATTVWDYINRAMPRNQEGSLSPNEVYAVSAFILYKINAIKESDVMDAKSLPKVQMPNRNGFLPARIEDIPDLRKRGCRLGHCTENSTSGSNR